MMKKSVVVTWVIAKVQMMLEFIALIIKWEMIYFLPELDYLLNHSEFLTVTYNYFVIICLLLMSDFKEFPELFEISKNCLHYSVLYYLRVSMSFALTLSQVVANIFAGQLIVDNKLVLWHTNEIWAIMSIGFIIILQNCFKGLNNSPLLVVKFEWTYYNPNILQLKILM